MADVKASGEDRPVQIVKIDDESETHNFILDEEALNEILNRDGIRDKPICIISVAGKIYMKHILTALRKIIPYRCLQKREILPVELHAAIFRKSRFR